MVLNLIQKSVFGNSLIYPNCTVSKMFSQLINQKTFTPRDLAIIKYLGYSLNITGDQNAISDVTDKILTIQRYNVEGNTKW
jgi:hypothetical protein